MRQIDTELYLGDAQDAGRPAELRRRGVTSVVSLIHADPDEPYPEAASVARFPLIDGPKADREPFAAAADRVRSELAAGEVVFCHCSAGVSRSAAVVAAAIAVRDGESFQSGLDRVEAAKPNVNPHPALVELGKGYAADSS